MSHILGSEELINGNDQRELSDRWWVQTNSTPNNVNPFVTDDKNDPRGRRGSVERHEEFQSESPDGVSFLGGILSGAIESPAMRTIVGRSDTVYFAPFVNQSADNTTDDFAPDSDFPGGYALNQQHLDDLKVQELNPRDPGSDLLGADPGSFPTLLSIVQLIVDGFTDQFVEINGSNVTPENIEDYRRETQDQDLSYDDLPRYIGGARLSPNIFVADPDLGDNLENEDPNDDIFPRLVEIDPSLKNAVVTFVQGGYYFAFELDPGAHTVRFGDDISGEDPSRQNVTYNVLNLVEGNNGTELNDYIDGGNGKDELLGLGGKDLIIGGNGKDLLDGGSDDDELWGDNSKDTFVFKIGYGKDTIFDFESGESVKIDGFSNFTVDDVTLTSGVDAAKITFNDDDILTIVGVQSDNLSIDITEGTITL